MRSSSSRAQASSIVIAALGLTLFASQPVLAKGPKPSKQKTEQTSVGTNGGGGGGAIICDEQQPVLTDYWEAANDNAVATERFKQLRTLNYPQLVSFFAKNWAEFFNETESEATLQLLINQLMMNAKKAITTPGRMQTFVLGDIDGLPVHIVVDKNVKDPNDTGKIVGLDSDRCREERVIVSFSDRGVENNPRSITIRIRQPEIFLKMPLFDQMGLLIGHEFMHVQSMGNVGRLANTDKQFSNSEMVRKLNAWVALSSKSDFMWFHARPTHYSRSMSCSAQAGDATQPGSTTKRINFNLYIDAEKNQSILELESYKGINTWLPVYAVLPLPPSAYKLPVGTKTSLTEFPQEGFYFKMEIPEEQTPVTKLAQVDFGQNYFTNPNSSLTDTGLSIQFIAKSNQPVLVRIVNSKGETELLGALSCFRLSN